MATRRYGFANSADIYVKSGSSQFKVVGSTGLLHSQGRPIFTPASTVYNPFTVDTIALTSLGASPSTTLPYGITYINATSGYGAATSAIVLAVGVPITGVRKTFIFRSSEASANQLNLDFSTNCGILSSSGSTDRYIIFSSLATEVQTLDLIGLSTSVWGVLGVTSTVGSFGAATGIRSAPIPAAT